MVCPAIHQRNTIRLGGITGDILGAVQQAALTTLLLTAAALWT